ncbi:hypothetical protein BDW22DRAFT_410727 [Trametopsis cervina]|nr:hypothetical protein BDW22DRAFT_410727 [Trametopsis cervina]
MLLIPCALIIHRRRLYERILYRAKAPPSCRHALHSCLARDDHPALLDMHNLFTTPVTEEITFSQVYEPLGTLNNPLSLQCPLDKQVAICQFVDAVILLIPSFLRPFCPFLPSTSLLPYPPRCYRYVRRLRSFSLKKSCSFFALASTAFRRYLHCERYWWDNACTFFSLLLVLVQIVAVFMHVPHSDSDTCAHEQRRSVLHHGSVILRYHLDGPFVDPVSRHTDRPPVL